MKYLVSLLIILSSFSLFLSSCDKVDPPYTEEGGGGNTDDFQQKILLEDYTGHRCVNCPTAAATAETLQDLYGEQLIFLAIHAGFFSFPNADLPADFRTEAGTEWDSFFGIGNAGNPNGMVNRRGYPSEHIVTPGSWGSAISELADNISIAKMEINHTYNSANRQLDVTVSTVFSQIPANDDINILVCLSESGIVSPQANSDENVGETPLIEDYVHKHMLRETLNGVWGESLTEGSIEAQVPIENTYKLTLSGEYVAENCSIVAFIYQNNNKEIIQVAEIGLNVNQTN